MYTSAVIWRTFRNYVGPVYSTLYVVTRPERYKHTDLNGTLPCCRTVGLCQKITFLPPSGKVTTHKTYNHAEANRERRRIFATTETFFMRWKRKWNATSVHRVNNCCNTYVGFRDATALRRALVTFCRARQRNYRHLTTFQKYVCDCRDSRVTYV